MTSHLTGAAREVVWIGRRHVDLARSPAATPLRVRADAFGAGLPRRDLRLSPEHAVFLDGVLIPIRCLENGESIARETSFTAVTYLHIELASHDVLLAEGLPAESWADAGNRAMFENAPVAALRPRTDLAEARAELCAPLVRDGELLAAIRARLGIVETVVPLAHEGRTEIVLPAGATRLRLVCPVATIAPDRRRLGALATGLWVDGTALDDAMLAGGWHEREPHGRWTDGDALVVLPASDKTRRVAIEIACRAEALRAA